MSERRNCTYCALRLPRLGKRELIFVLFVRLFDLRLFGFVCFLFLLVSGKGCALWLWHSLDFFSYLFFTSCETSVNYLNTSVVSKATKTGSKMSLFEWAPNVYILKWVFISALFDKMVSVLSVCVILKPGLCSIKQITHESFSKHIFSHLLKGCFNLLIIYNKNSAEGVVAPAGAKVTGATIRTWLLDKFISFLAVLSWKPGLKKCRQSV